MPIANGVLHAEPGSIFVFVDETGHEYFADTKHPVFGLGGCVFPANYSATIVDAPWKALKQTHFPATIGKAFHAAEIKSITSKQAEAFGAFFRQNPLRRFASVIRASASNPDVLAAVRLYRIWSEHITSSLREYPFLEVAAGAAIWPLCISCISISVAACFISPNVSKGVELVAKAFAASLLLSVWIGVSLSTFMWVFGRLANDANNVGAGIVALLLALVSAGCVFIAPIWLFDKARNRC